MNIDEVKGKKGESLVETLNDNKLLIGAAAGVIAAGIGLAYYLFATESGRRLRNDIEDKSLDIYDLVSEEAAEAVERLRQLGQNILADQDAEPVHRNIRRVA